MDRQERKKLEQIRADLASARKQTRLHAEYIMGKAHYGAGGVIDKAVKDLTALLDGSLPDDAAD